MHRSIEHLAGGSLDYAVGIASLCDFDLEHGVLGTGRTIWQDGIATPELYAPSTDWSQGGPLIDKALIALSYPGEDVCRAEVQHPGFKHSVGLGSTALVAAMRAFVRSKLGDTVYIPDDIVRRVSVSQPN